MRRHVCGLLACLSAVGCGDKSAPSAGTKDFPCEPGSVSPGTLVIINPGKSVSVALDFRTCASVRVSATNDPVYAGGKVVAVDAVLELAPPLSTTYTLEAKGSRIKKVVRTLPVDVIPTPTVVIERAAIPDSGIVLGSTVTLPVTRSYVSTCTQPTFTAVPSQSDQKAFRGSINTASGPIVFAAPSTMPALQDGARKVTISINCLGQDGSATSASVGVKLSVPSLLCASMLPDSLKMLPLGPGEVGSLGPVTIECNGNSVTANNGVDFSGTVIGLTNEGSPAPPDSEYTTFAGLFQTGYRMVFYLRQPGPPSANPQFLRIWVKQSERSEPPRSFLLRLYP